MIGFFENHRDWCSYISDEQITNIARKYTRKSEKQFLKETAVRENKEIGISDSMMFKF